METCFSGLPTVVTGKYFEFYRKSCPRKLKQKRNFVFPPIFTVSKRTILRVYPSDIGYFVGPHRHQVNTCAGVTYGGYIHINTCSTLTLHSTVVNTYIACMICTALNRSTPDCLMICFSGSRSIRRQPVRAALLSTRRKQPPNPRRFQRPTTALKDPGNDPDQYVL